MRIVASTEPAASPTGASNASETRSLRLEASGGPNTRPLVDTSYERREHLERELDRVQNSLLGERAMFGHQLNWLMLSQALLLNAFLLVLILGWSTPLPAKRLLLAGIAVFAATVALLIVLALRGTRDALMSLHQHRKTLEATLQKDFGRPPLYAPRALVTRGLAGFANGLLPATFVAGWIALTIYTLAAPLGMAADPVSGIASAIAAPAVAKPVVRSATRSAQGAAAVTTVAAGVIEPQVIEATPVEVQPVAAPRKAGGFKW